MPKMVHARIDEETEGALQELVTRLGWSESRIVREGIMRLLRSTVTPVKKRIIGIGKFTSGIPDLGSNKDHLRGFGR